MLCRVLKNDADAIQAHDKIYRAIAGPYMFGDHANKSFARQYAFLRRTQPELFQWKRCEPATLTLILACDRRSPRSALPRELYMKIHEYARQPDVHDLLLRSMALATNKAFYWHSD